MEMWYNKEMEKEKLQFPTGFLWGAATSSHQVEGDNLNDWTVWEKENAQRLAEEANFYFGHFSNWPQIKDKAQNPANYISGQACDHYHNYEKDFDLIKDLDQNAYRFSLEWSRIEPAQGVFDKKEIEHYRQMLLALKQRNIKPFVTLWHWTNPLWLRKEGGWLNKKAPKYFEQYVKEVIRNLGDLADFWITINEPMVYVKNHLGVNYSDGKKGFISKIEVIKNLIIAHKKAYQAIHQFSEQKKAGISQHCVFFEGWLLNKIAGYFINYYFLNRIKKYQDFIGLNYYSNKNFFKKNKNEVSDLGWEICPKGIYYILKDLKKYQKPVYITENGLADADDSRRSKFIIEHLFWTYKAILEKVDVRGYFHWSLLDNFEWDRGFWPRFGLYAIDYQNQQRTIRPSARLYSFICRRNCLIINKL